jgi:hypothetical protein
MHHQGSGADARPFNDWSAADLPRLAASGGLATGVFPKPAETGRAGLLGAFRCQTGRVCIQFCIKFCIEFCIKAAALAAASSRSGVSIGYFSFRKRGWNLILEID